MQIDKYRETLVAAVAVIVAANVVRAEEMVGAENRSIMEQKKHVDQNTPKGIPLMCNHNETLLSTVVI